VLNVSLHAEGGGAGVGAGVVVGGGAGVGGGPPSPTYKNTLVSPDLNPSMPFHTELFFNNSKTSSPKSSPVVPSICKATAPDTWGQAIDVPLMVADPESEVWDADFTLLPGAQISVQLP